MKIYIILNVFAPKTEAGKISTHLLVGGAEVQALRLANKMQDNADITIVSRNTGNTPKEEKIGNVNVLRYNIPAFVQKGRQVSRKKRTQVKSYNDFDWRNRPNNLYREKKYTITAFMSHLVEFVALFTFLFKRRKEIDIIYVPMISYLGQISTFIALLLGKKIILNDATMDGLERMYNCFMPNYSRKVLIKHAYFIAISKEIERMYIRNGVDESKIKYIPNGIDLPNHPVERTNNKTCLFVGNLYQQPAKGIDVLMIGWKEILKTHPDAKLTIIGDGEEDYIHYANQLELGESIRFTGKADPNPYYKTQNIFILPSRREGMSNALMEAMSYGMPILATKISGSTDLVEGKNCGILVNPDSVEELTDALNQMLSMSATELNALGQNSRKAVYNLCNFELIGNQFEEYVNYINKL
jgi:glycosyltransferase involved in cell wall biosynthesis